MGKLEELRNKKKVESEYLYPSMEDYKNHLESSGIQLPSEFYCRLNYILPKNFNFKKYPLLSGTSQETKELLRLVSIIRDECSTQDLQYALKVILVKYSHQEKTLYSVVSSKDALSEVDMYVIDKLRKVFKYVDDEKSYSMLDDLSTAIKAAVMCIGWDYNYPKLYDAKLTVSDLILLAVNYVQAAQSDIEVLTKEDWEHWFTIKESEIGKINIEEINERSSKKAKDVSTSVPIFELTEEPTSVPVFELTEDSNIMMMLEPVEEFNPLQQIQSIAEKADSAYNSVKVEYSRLDFKVSDNPEIWIDRYKVEEIYNKVFDNTEFAKKVKGANIGYRKSATELKDLFYKYENESSNDHSIYCDKSDTKQMLMYIFKAKDKSCFFNKSCSLKQVETPTGVSFNFTGGYRGAEFNVYSLSIGEAIYIWDKELSHLFVFSARDFGIALKFYFAVCKLATVL